MLNTNHNYTTQNNNFKLKKNASAFMERNNIKIVVTCR